MTLDEMIAAAKSRLDNASDENAKLQAAAEVDALTKAKEAGYTKTQDDLNAVDKQNKDALKNFREEVEKYTGPWDSFKETLANVEQQIVTDPDAAGQGDGDPAGKGDADPAASRVFAELKNKDAALEAERNERLKFEREYRQERLTNTLRDQFKSLGLQDSYSAAAHEFISPHLSTLVEKAMKGEDVTQEVQQQAERVKELSGVWFKAPEPENGIPIPPGVERSPNGGEPRQLTDEEREQRSESVI